MLTTRPGLEATRAIISIALNGGSAYAAQTQLEATYGADSAPARAAQGFASGVKAAVDAGATTDSNWAASAALAPLVELRDAVTEQTVLARLNAMPVPPNSTVAALDTAIAASWRGEGSPIPATAGTAGSETLRPLSVAAIVVASHELLAHSHVNASEFLRRRLISAAAEAVDAAFCDPSNAGSAGVRPASIFSAPTAVTSGGNVADDLAALVDDFTGDLTRAVFIGHPKTFAAIASAEHPDVGIRGGSLIGAPAIASRSCPDDILGLVDADGIALVLGTPEVDASTEAAFEMADDPTSPANQTSLWQNGLVAIKLTMQANWAAVRPGAASYVAGINY